MADDAYQPSREYLARLRRQIDRFFNLDEIKTLCFDMGIDFEILPPGGKDTTARELVSYSLRRGELVQLVQHCAAERPFVSWAEDPEKELAQKRLEERVATGELDIPELATLIRQGDYSEEFIEWLIANLGVSTNLRVFALKAYVASGARNDALLVQLLGDFDQDIRKVAIRIIQEREMPISEDALRQLISDPSTSQDVMINAVRLAGELAKAHKISLSVLALDRIVNHRYWAIRRDAITAIIDTDDGNSVRLLARFGDTTTYWLSRKRIFKYLQRLDSENRLTDSDRAIASALLLKFIQDGKSSEQAQRSMRKIWNKINGIDSVQIDGTSEDEDDDEELEEM